MLHFEVVRFLSGGGGLVVQSLSFFEGFAVADRAAFEVSLDGLDVAGAFLRREDKEDAEAGVDDAVDGGDGHEGDEVVDVYDDEYW